MSRRLDGVDDVGMDTDRNQTADKPDTFWCPRCGRRTVRTTGQCNQCDVRDARRADAQTKGQGR